MLSANEIVHWLEDERERTRDLLSDETDHNNNHLATAYGAELDLIDRLLADIRADETTQHDDQLTNKERK